MTDSHAEPSSASDPDLGYPSVQTYEQNDCRIVMKESNDRSRTDQTRQPRTYRRNPGIRGLASAILSILSGC